MMSFARIATVLSLASVGFAAIPNIFSFSVDGALDGCTPDGTDYNSGGSISVNGFAIKVPKNLIAQFPVAWVPFKQMCDEGGAGGYEVSVVGNVVGEQAIAAQISVGAPFLVEGSIGYIDEVNIAGGYLKIKAGPKVFINDPDAVYSKGLKERSLFLADTGTPSITAFSGFPMCIPRSATDDKCPSSNRPAGQTSFDAPDPLVMAPFLAGDFIEYSGLKRANGDILAWSITAINVQITTKASDTVPNYIRMEDALIGVFDSAGNVENADIRFIGFLSSCTGASVTISAIEVDPCTGKENYRQIGTQTPKAGDARCKFEFRINNPGSTTYTREYEVKVNSAVIKTKNGIEAGRAVQPVTEWIQPEVDIPGTQPPPFRFQDIRGLVQGDFLDGKQFGQLSPFPGPAVPAPDKTCSPSDIPTDPTTEEPAASNVDPVAAIAAISAVQRVGVNVLLAGSQTAQGIPASNLVFQWTKTSPASPSVSIQNAASPTATIIAPSVTTQTDFTFKLKVSLKSDPTKSSEATVTVKISPTPNDVVTLDSYTWESRQSGTINVACHSNVVNGDNKKMSLLINGGPTPLTMIAGTSPGTWTYNARSTKRPTNVQCVSDLKGKSALVTATTSRRRRGELGLDLTSRAEWA